MVEKIWVCTIKCGYVPQNIPYDEQPRMCPKCGSPCREADFIPAGHFGADTKAMMEDYKRESRVLEPVNPDEKGREARIKETIEGMTNREYVILESKEGLVVRFKKTDDETDVKLREELEKEFRKFHPRVIFILFF